MHEHSIEPVTLAVHRLRDAVKGEVIAPDDLEYDDARAVYYGIDRRPAVVVRPADSDDVAVVIDLARASGSELAVRSGGHSLAGHSVSEGGIVLDLSGMKGIHIDPEQCTAWAQAGLTAGELTKAAGAHGLAAASATRDRWVSVGSPSVAGSGSWRGNTDSPSIPSWPPKS